MEDYTKKYYAAINLDEAIQAKILAKAIEDLYHPKTMIDLGCGTGLYMKEFKCDKSGLDISPEAFDQEVLMVDRSLVSFEDLRFEKESVTKRDLALCLEVVEHIGCEYADVLVKNITNYSDLIVMTAAGIGQAGLNHVNCQPQKYWDEKFEALGYQRQYHGEFEIINKVHQHPHTIWIIRNLMIYKKWNEKI